jgi:hypothetical protein
MRETLLLSSDSQRTAGILLLAIVAIEYGGIFMLSIVRGRHPMTDFQKSFARAGHAHAGVLVTLALVCQILVDAAQLSGLPEGLARSAIPAAALLLPGGFFFSSMGRDVTRPNRFVVLIYAGIVSLAAGVVALGIGLLSA